MSGTVTTIYAQSFTWNAITFNSTVNGLIRVEIENGGEPLESRAGDNQYAPQVFIVNKSAKVRVSMREFKFTGTPGDGPSNGVAIVKHKSGTKTVTVANLILARVSSTQGRAEESETTLEFVHESSDGSTNPVS